MSRFWNTCINNQEKQQPRNVVQFDFIQIAPGNMCDISKIQTYDKHEYYLHRDKVIENLHG